DIFRVTEGAFEFHRGPWLLGRGGRPPTASYVLAGRREQVASAHRVPWLRRGDELETIRDALVRAGSGQGTAVLIHGEGGSGKTRLVQELVALARRRHVPVHLGRASGFGNPLAAPLALVRSI